jgi:hypothetical protein
MKKLLFVLFALLLFCVQAGSIESSATGYVVNGPTQATLTGSSVGASYYLYSPPSGATFEWSILSSGGAYISSTNGSYCSLTFYQTGSCRLTCDVYINGVKEGSGAIYITIN